MLGLRYSAGLKIVNYSREFCLVWMIDCDSICRMIRALGWMFASIVGLSVCACCHVNRLGELDQGSLKVECYCQVVEKPTVSFFRHQRFESEFAAQPGPARGYSETRFDEILISFGPGELVSQLLQKIPGVLEQSLGWKLPRGDQQPELDLVVTVEDYGFVSADAQSELMVDWYLRAILTKKSNGDIVWRDCMQWQTGGLQVSMLQLAKTEPDQRKEIIQGMADALIEKLAAHLVSERSNAE